MNIKKKVFLVFDSNMFLSKRTSEFLGLKNILNFSYENPFKLIFYLLSNLSKIRKNKIFIVVAGFRLPDLLVLRISNILNLNSIYIQHGIFLSHLNRSKYLNNSKFIPYVFYFFILSCLLISPIKIFNLYKNGLSGDFPAPTFSLVYNKFWADFHKNLLGWKNCNHVYLGVFDLSRNTLSKDGIIK